MKKCQNKFPAPEHVQVIQKGCAVFRFENIRPFLRKVDLNFNASTKTGRMSVAGSIPLSSKTLLPSSLATIIASFHVWSHSEPIPNVLQRSDSDRVNPLSPRTHFSPRTTQRTSISDCTSALSLWKHLLALFQGSPIFSTSFTCLSGSETSLL